MRGVNACLFAMVVLVAAVARGDDSLFKNVDYREVVRDLEQNGGRFYLAGIMGGSFATLTSPGNPSSNGPLFTSGGAAGMAFAWLDRAWRLEVEGRARDPLSQTIAQPEYGEGATSTLTATGGWSTTLNLWRDYHVTDRLTWYIGGGVGGGGYRFGVNQVAPLQDQTTAGVGTVGGFAWQAGGGLAWSLTDRITLDLGYRYFELNGGVVNAGTYMTQTLIDTTPFSSAFSANELFFAIRIYEPFRRWR